MQLRSYEQTLNFSGLFSRHLLPQFFNANSSTFSLAHHRKDAFLNPNYNIDSGALCVRRPLRSAPCVNPSTNPPANTIPSPPDKFQHGTSL
jgi:hypothetical protein